MLLFVHAFCYRGPGIAHQGGHLIFEYSLIFAYLAKLLTINP